MEKKDIRDYLKYYIGCECKMIKPSYHAVHELHLSSDRLFVLTGKLQHYFSDNTTKAEISPILSRLEDITDDDIKGLIGYEKLIEIYSGVEYRKERNRVDVNYDVDMEDFGKQPFYHSVKFYQLEPRQFHYLLSKGYWLFGDSWFDEGIIIDKKSLK